jgi:hypothetical protein
MKKILNSSFFGVCFLAALLAEAYFIRIGTENLFSVVGIGIVTLITGYLLIDSIRSGLDKRINDAKLYMDQIYREEAERSSERYTNDSNLHKATYTAMKKSTMQMSQHAKEVMERLETLEHNMEKALATITELQKKAMEGQKKALNYEINYSKENTKHLIQALREDNNRADIEELLMKLLTGMERNNELMEKQLDSFKNISFEAISTEPSKKSDQSEDVVENEDVVEIDWNDIAEQESEDFTSTEWDSDVKEPIVENLTETGWDVDAEVMLGNITDGWEVSGNIDDNAPETTAATAGDPESEAVQVTEDINNSTEGQEAEPEKQTITPLYSDPNKNLTANEIASLFASFGQ